VIVISDTSPINYLCLIGCVDVLPALFGEIIIPSAVETELTRKASPEAVRQLMSSPPEWIEIRKPANEDPLLAKFGSGEREAISLAEELNAELLIIDDKAARHAAVDRNVAVLGTLGVLQLASSRGLLDLRLAIDKLQDSSFYVSAGILKQLFSDKQ